MSEIARRITEALQGDGLIKPDNASYVQDRVERLLVAPAVAETLPLDPMLPLDLTDMKNILDDCVSVNIDGSVRRNYEMAAIMANGKLKGHLLAAQAPNPARCDAFETQGITTDYCTLSKNHSGPHWGKYSNWPTEAQPASQVEGARAGCPKWELPSEAEQMEEENLAIIAAQIEARNFTLPELNASALMAGIASPRWNALEKQLAQALLNAQAAEQGALRRALRDEVAWLIERGQLCLGFCERKFSWVTFTDESALRFARRSDAIRFIETMREQLDLWEVSVNEHLWAGPATPAEQPAPAKEKWEKRRGTSVRISPP
jgi:hypothetical protein